MKAQSVSEQYRVNGNPQMTVELALPGQIIGVEDNRVILSVPVIEGPQMLTAEARKSVTDGLSDMDAELLIERIAHFAITESMRARVSFKHIITRSTTPAL